MKILSICPSIREDKLQEMAESFYDTSEEKNSLCISSTGTVTEAINKYKDYEADYFHLTNDDVLYRTKGWDTKLVAALEGRPGIAYGNDLAQGQALCTFPLISAALVKAVGWLQLPSLIKYFGDTCWFDLGKELGLLHYCEDVVIEHFTWLNQKSQEIPNHDTYQKDLVSYFTWATTEMPLDVLKIKMILNEGNLND